MGGMGGLADPSAALLATCGGDTVKLFDLTVDSGDPCTLSHTPAPGSHVNCVKWNHTNLVIASAGEDKKISLCRKNGQSIGTVPLAGADAGDNITECISSVSFSNKGSRYLCSGGSSHIVRIWDLQRKRCIKWLSGHTDTITGVMYNCKDEHLASVSLKGDIILHNLASGARAAEWKDPNGQVLRVLDYSRLSRHILVTAGDDGSVHLWDVTSRSPKASWLKQHSAPITGVCFCPSNDKIVASVGLDKKLYTFDSGNRKATSCIPHESPFSSLAFRDDGLILAAGTNTGRVVFYDVRGKPQPLTVLRAYSSSEAVTCLCWQRSKPVVVSENCTSEIALLGGTAEDSVLMPDPLPSMSSIFSSSATIFSRGPFTTTSSDLMSTAVHSSAVEETPLRSDRNQLWQGGSLSRLQAPRNNFNLKDDMDVFSPLVDVQPITPSVGNWWDDHEETKKDGVAGEKSTLFHSSIRKLSQPEANADIHPVSDWRADSSSGQEDVASTASWTDTLATNSRSEISSTTATEALSGSILPDKLTTRHEPVTLSRFQPTGPLASASMLAGKQDLAISSNFPVKGSLAGPAFSSLNVQGNPGTSESSSAFQLSSLSTSLGSKALTIQTNLEIPGALSSIFPHRLSKYSEKISTMIGDASVSAIGSPKSKKTGVETREDLINSLLSRHETLSSTGTGSSPAINTGVAQSADQLQGASSFSLQLIQRTLEESLGSMQMSIHEDVRNLHVELLRQFHMHEMEMSTLMNSILEKLDDVQKEVQSLRKENQQLRMLL